MRAGRAATLAHAAYRVNTMFSYSNLSHILCTKLCVIYIHGRAYCSIDAAVRMHNNSIIILLQRRPKRVDVKSRLRALARDNDVIII